MTVPDDAAHRARNPMVIATIVSIAFFMESLDSTVIVTALPQMAHSFGESSVRLSLGISVYMLTLAVVIPASGWIADRFGARRVFCFAIALFTLASMLCGASNSLWQFVGARILQGVGGAMMSPVGRIVVLRMTEKAHLVRVMNFITVPGLIGPVLGPPVGGFLTTYASWRWIFFLNVPICIAGITMAYLYIRNLDPAKPRPFDLTGFLLNGVTMASLMFGLDVVAGPGSNWQLGGGMILGGLIVGFFAGRHALRTPHPLVDVRALKVKTYAVVNSGGSMFRMSMSAPTFLMPLFFQVGLGMSAFASGMLILCHAAGDLGIKVVTTRSLRWFGFRTMLIASASTFACFIVACANFTPQTPAIVIMALLFVGGAVRSLQMTSLGSLQFSDIPPGEITGASTLSGVNQQLMRSFGVAMAAVVLNLAVAYRGGMPGVLTLIDFRIAFYVTAGICLGAVLWYLPLEKNVGSHVSGHQRANAP
jgi:EmrB/QacA subfamily drug resistance transporter